MESIRLNIKKRLDAAVAEHKKVFDVCPDQAEVYNSLGNTLIKEGEYALAAASFKRAIIINPNYASAYDNLGMVMNIQGERFEAISAYQKAVQLNPQSGSAKHMLAAISGEITERAPVEYIKSLFDQYAARFDEHLTGTLQYSAPHKLFHILHQITRGGMYFHNAVDLGCGTGLSGESFREVTARLTGVDLSEKMLAEADKKKVYDDLKEEDLVVFLESCQQKFDLFLAADVFVYFGDLNRIFQAVQSCAAKSAFFIFSVESCKGRMYALNPTGRYSHSRAYLFDLTTKYGFSVEAVCSFEIRKEIGQWIMGDHFILLYRH